MLTLLKKSNITLILLYLFSLHQIQNSEFQRPVKETENNSVGIFHFILLQTGYIQNCMELKLSLNIMFQFFNSITLTLIHWLIRMLQERSPTWCQFTYFNKRHLNCYCILLINETNGKSRWHYHYSLLCFDSLTPKVQTPQHEAISFSILKRKKRLIT